MQKRVSTVIDGVPVVFELLSIGPATPEALTTFEANISKEVSLNPSLSIPTQDGKLQVVQVGNGVAPASAADIEKVQKAINTGAIDPAALIDRLNQIEQALASSTVDKPWWTSRTIISNVVFIIVAIAAVFGFQISISEEWITLIGVLMGIVNIWLRKTTTQPLSKRMLPS